MESQSNQLLEEQIITFIAKYYGKESGEINRESNFRNDLGAESTDILDLALGLEEEFDVGGVFDGADRMHTVGNVVDFIVRVKNP